MLIQENALKKNTEILMSNGQIKLVQDIKQNDEIMGFNSIPRKVVNITKGHGELFEIRQSCGSNYTVNKHHVLTLAARSTFSREYQVVDISVRKFLTIPKNQRKNFYGIQSSVDFPTKSTSQNPFEFGKSIGKQICKLIDNMDQEIPLIIPDELKSNSVYIRKNLLEGILDSLYLYYNTNSNSFLIPLKQKINTEIYKDLLFVSRSLGVECISRENEIEMKYNIFLQDKERNFNTITMSELEIEFVGEDEYYGFQLDRQAKERFFLGNFTITHNSTIMGHLLLDLGLVSQHQLSKNERESEKIGRKSFKFAWFLDEHEDERSHGVTIDVGVKHFETKNKSITLLDTPGHSDFIPNMISGASQADVAILVVDADVGAFEKGFFYGQTKEHVQLVRSMGITQLIVAVNKMDCVDYSNKRFDEIKSKLQVFLVKIGFQQENIQWIPCSGFEGWNLFSNQNFSKEILEKTKWYNGNPLVDAIDSFKSVARDLEKPFRLCISDVFSHQIYGLTVTGKVESGNVMVSDKILVMPIAQVCTIKNLKLDQKDVQFAQAGDNIQIGISGVDESLLSTGQILCDPEFPIPIVTEFKAHILTRDLPNPIVRGSPGILYSQSLNESAIIKEIIGLIDKTTNQLLPKKVKVITSHSLAMVLIETSRPVCLENFENMKQFGRFAFRFQGKTVASGIVKEIMTQK